MDEQLIEYYSAMSNFELSDLALTYGSFQQETLTVFASVLFAYLAGAYLVGEKLTKFQVFSVSILYSAFELNMIFGYYGTSVYLSDLTEFLTGNRYALRFISTVAVLTVAWILSLIFMAQSRTRNDT